MRMQVFTGYDHFSNKKPDIKGEQLARSTKGICKKVAQLELGSEELARLEVLEAEGTRFTDEIGGLCERVATRMLAGITNTTNASMVRGLIAHAAHTNDGGEILRIVNGLALKGTLQ
ncbi:hypothetical protein [Bifidobacterium crudilactis]|uniref:hypothetical protein n=1 Tax=Bifidobacterium crudilactis TaxID=327277 RepID=UPI0023552CE6|nr:hypothetical protein [Bifidobacterium crudilactis]MCI1868283.1 hypothetical protein [Bifidobacterium crudilactis]